MCGLADVVDGNCLDESWLLICSYMAFADKSSIVVLALV